MLFPRPGSAQLARVNTAYVTETETAEVTNFWEQQARREYDRSLDFPGSPAGRTVAEHLDRLGLARLAQKRTAQLPAHA